MRPGHSTTLHISPTKGYYRTSYVGHVRRMDASLPQVGIRGGGKQDLQRPCGRLLQDLQMLSPPKWTARHACRFEGVGRYVKFST
jgi:hypothetical protein